MSKRGTVQDKIDRLEPKVRRLACFTALSW